MSELEPKPARNRQQQNHRPADGKRHWNRGEKRQPLPERHPEKHVSNQAWREFAFDPVSLKVVIQLRDFAERVGRKEPDFSGIRVRDPDEDNGNIRIATGKNSDGLLIGGAVIRIAFGIGAEPSQAAHEGAVHEHLQFFGQVPRPATGGARRSFAGSRRRSGNFRPARLAGIQPRLPKASHVPVHRGRELPPEPAPHPAASWSPDWAISPGQRNENDKYQQRQFFHRGSSKGSGLRATSFE